MLLSNEFDYREASRRFIEIRTQNGKTQEQLAEILGVAIQTIKNYEKAGSYNVRDSTNTDRINAIGGMKAETLFKMAKYFNVSADYLLCISGAHSQDQSIKSMVEQLGLPEHLIVLLLDWINLRQYDGDKSGLSELQKHIVDIADEMYPMQKNRYLNASEDFKMLITYFLESLYDRPALILDAFSNARVALENDRYPTDCDIDTVVAHQEELEKFGYLSLPAEEIGEWYLRKMLDVIRVQMKDSIERFG